MSETKDECGESSNAEHRIEMEEANKDLPNGDLSESGLKVERGSDSLVKDKKTVEVKPLDPEVLVARRILRSGSVARDPVSSNKRRRAVKRKGKGTADKGDLGQSKDMGEVSGRSLVDEVKEEAKQEDVEEGSFEPPGKEVEVKRKRGRPRKYGISSQSDVTDSISNCKLGISLDKKEELVTDDNVVDLIGGSSSNEEKTKVKLVQGEYAEAKEIPGAEFGTQVKVEIQDDRSDDEKGNAEPHGEEPQVKRKRGRPRKVQISSQSDDNTSNTSFKLVKIPDSSSQSIVDRLCLKRQRGRPPKTKETTGGMYIKKEDVNCIPESILITADQSVSDSIDESTRTKSNCGGSAKGPESDGGNCEGRKMARKRGRPATPQKKKDSGEADESDCEAKMRLKLRESPLEPPQHSNPLTDGELRIGEQENKQNDQSVSDSIDESRRPKSNCGGRAKGPESDGGNSKGRKMACKRGRPATSQKKKESGEADESDCKAKKRLKHCESPLEPQHSNLLTDDERRIGEQENKQNEGGRRSISKSKKMLSDRILQLLLAAGWTVEYRPRNGRAYQDAVYLNPEGKTHWSVTKAYQVYKKHLESSMNGQMDSTSGTGFGLLPEEELHLLGRTVQKKRCDKGKQHRPKSKDGDATENMVSTKGLGKRTLHGKKGLKRRQKGSHGSHNLEKVSVPVRKIKREEKQKRKRCAPSARSSLEDADSKKNGYIFFDGKRTILGWMIDAAIVPLNGKVLCMDCNKTQVLLEGIITKEGVRCNCCDEVFSVLDFEVHAGGKRNQPFKSLYLEGGNSLLQCLLDSLNNQSEPQNKGFHFVDFGNGGDPNDDTCGICGDGGDLICCDACPATFHQSCLDIKKFPSGAWFCCYCSCKFCEKVEAVNHDTETLAPLSSCRLCEEKYHQACINQDGMVPGEESADSFCGKHCQELFEELQLLIGVKHPLPEGFSWTFLRRFELPTEISDCETSEKIAYNAKMAVAFSVMDECFSPFVDHRSGVNLLQNIVYNFGSNFHRYNFSNFLTAVLERGDEVIGVASIRIHGNQLAEMPFIGTRSMYRRQGMCRRLMDGIESALGSLKIDKLVIPAVQDLIDTWTLGFGFTPINESGKKKIKNLNLLVFPGVDMLEKPVLKEKIADTIVSSSNGSLPLAPEMSLPVDVEETKPEESKDSADERNRATDVESSSMNVEEGDNDTESNLKLPNKDLEKKEEIGNLTVKDVDSLPDEVDDSQADQTDTKRKDTGDLEDKTLLSDDDAGGKAEDTEESDEQSDCIIIDNPQPLSNGGTGKAIDNKNLALKREVTSTLRVSPRLMQRSWRTSRVN
ncbi:Increased DNA methylation 1 [Cardamine amara subsp. amara]|uniref:Increased DNA methylation 1 n=1 Tax=Cardamine amara subsp. amara TaxID=228776 RepID=A0ABD0ZTR8_CARAN